MKLELIVTVMSENHEIIAQRFKVQYIDNRGEWRDFGPILSLTEDGALGYFREFNYALRKKARIVKVTEEAVRYLHD